jgi:hypothetical protein
MKFFTPALTTLLATLTAAAPAQDTGVSQLVPKNLEVLEGRQIWCTDCKNHSRVCCSAVQCNPPSKC